MKKKKKQKSYIDLFNETRDRSFRGRPVVMLSGKDKSKKRNNIKKQTKKEIDDASPYFFYRKLVKIYFNKTRIKKQYP